MKILRITGNIKESFKITLQTEDENILESSYFSFNLNNKSKVIPPLRKKLSDYWRVQINDTTHKAACISSQIGCPLNCIFCINGHLPFIRNLHWKEIIEELQSITATVSNYEAHFYLREIQFGGVGEPLLNYDNVIESLYKFYYDEEVQKLLHIEKEKLIAILPTSGATTALTSSIHKLADEKLPIFLQISLHASNNDIRKKVVPISNVSIEDIFSSLKYYAVHSSLNPIIINYVLLDGVNDSPIHAAELANLVHAHDLSEKSIVKISVLNQISNNNLKSSPKYVTNCFTSILKNRGLNALVFKSMASEITAGCGQLRYYELINNKNKRRFKGGP